MADITIGDKLKANDLLRNKLDNFLEALGGKKPTNEDERGQAYAVLQEAFNLDLDKVVDHYINYQKSNPIKKYFTKALAKQAISSHADSFIQNLNQNTLPMLSQTFANMENPYYKNIVSGIQNLVTDKSSGAKAMKRLMDFTDLEQPIPFVTSKIGYMLPPNNQVPQ